MFKSTLPLLGPFKPTQALQQRKNAWKFVPMPAKKGNKYFYKGNKVGSRGHFDKTNKELQKRRNFIVDYTKARTYICPDLTDCKLTPFVSRLVEDPKDRENGYIPYNGKEDGRIHPIKGEAYLQMWRELNTEGT